MGRAQRKVKREEASLEGLDEVFSGDIQNENNVDSKSVEMLFEDDADAEQSESEPESEPAAREAGEESPV